MLRANTHFYIYIKCNAVTCTHDYKATVENAFNLDQKPKCDSCAPTETSSGNTKFSTCLLRDVRAKLLILFAFPADFHPGCVFVFGNAVNSNIPMRRARIRREKRKKKKPNQIKVVSLSIFPEYVCVCVCDRESFRRHIFVCSASSSL